MLAWDRQLDDWVVGHRVGLLDPIAQALTYVGTSGFIWLVLALALAIVRGRGGVFVWTLVADALAAFLTNVIKLSTGRTRPDVDALIPRPHTSSFPSGHSATAFACAVVLGA